MKQWKPLAFLLVGLILLSLIISEWGMMPLIRRLFGPLAGSMRQPSIVFSVFEFVVLFGGAFTLSRMLLHLSRPMLQGNEYAGYWHLGFSLLGAAIVGLFWVQLYEMLITFPTYFLSFVQSMNWDYYETTSDLVGWAAYGGITFFLGYIIGPTENTPPEIV